MSRRPESLATRTKARSRSVSVCARIARVGPAQAKAPMITPVRAIVVVRK